MLNGSPLITAYSFVMAALLGLVMGSFINCWAWRYLNGESVLKGRSHCTSCGHVLGIRDLVPLLSWLLLRGKCRYCGAKVSVRYPLVELICALVFVGIVAVYGVTLETLELFVFTCVLLFLSLTDLDAYLIPNGCHIVALATRAIYLCAMWAMGVMTGNDILYYVGSAFGIGVALVIVVLVADHVFGRESMGGGDLKLYFVAGFYFGWQQCLLLVIISCVFGIVVAVVSHSRASSDIIEQPAAGEGSAEQGAAAEAVSAADEAAGQADAHMQASTPEPSETQPDGLMTRTIPFGPSIAAACVVVMLVGQPLIDWYKNLLF